MIDKEKFSPTKRQYSKRNLINVVEYYIPSYYKDEDHRLHGEQTEIFSEVINSHINFAANIENILPLTDGQLYSALNTLSGIAPFFDKQNSYSRVTPKSFELNILGLDGKSFRNFNSSAAFQEYLATDLIPKIKNSGPELSSVDYLIDQLGWFYFLAGSSTYSYQPSTVVIEAFTETLYRGGTLDIDDGINCLTKFLWNNFSSVSSYDVIPKNYYPNNSLTTSNAYTSGTQNLEKLKTLNSVIYSTYVTDIQDTKVRDAFDAYQQTSLLLSDRESAGPFHRLLKAFSIGFSELQDPVNVLEVIYDINNCPSQYLPELAKLIGWRLFGYDENKWRLQLINAVSIYKKVGTKQSLQAGLDSIFSPGVIDLDSYIYELWESYLPFLLWYALATESELFTSLDVYTREVAYQLNVDTYSRDSIEENIKIAIDNIIGRLLEEFPELFIINGQFFPKDDPNFKFEYRGRVLDFPPFEEHTYYTDCNVREDLILRVIDLLVCFGVPQNFAEQVGSYLRENTVLATDDIREQNTWLMFTSGHNEPPNWDSIIADPTNKKEEYLSLWSGKSSHYKLIFDAGNFNFINKSLQDSDSREVISFASKVANEFSPAHAIQHTNVVLSDSDEQVYVSQDEEITLFDVRDYAEITASSNSLSRTFVSGVSMNPGGGDFTVKRHQLDSIYDSILNTDQTVVTPRNTIRRRNYKNNLNLGGAYDRTGYNPPTSLNNTNTIQILLTKDSNGVASIDTDGGMEYGYYGLGYSHAKDAGDIFLLRYILLSGRGLQYFPDEFPTYFSADGLGNIIPGSFIIDPTVPVEAPGNFRDVNISSVTTSSLSAIGFTQHYFDLLNDAEVLYEKMPLRYKRALDYYVRGFNKGIEVHKDRLAVSSFCGSSLATKPPTNAFDTFTVSPVDVILATNWFTMEGNIKNTLTRAKNFKLGLEGQASAPIYLGDVYEHSNQWAARGTITDTGRPIKMIDPHLPMPIGGDYAYQIFPANIRTKDWEWFGGGPVGTLFMALGSNKWLAYSLTANGPLHVVMYGIEKDTQGSYNTHRTTGFIDPVERQESLQTSSGAITHTIFHTTHGAILCEYPSRYVSFVHNFRGANILLQFMQMADSKTLDEFNIYYGKMHSIGYNCVVATNEGPYGNIQYCHGGRVRKMRDESRQDYRNNIPMASATNIDWVNSLTTNEPSYSDNDMVYYSFFNGEMPVLKNPESGYLVCNNASPSLVTKNCPLRNSNYPSSMIVTDSDENPITNNRHNRARYLFDSTLSSGGKITYELSKQFSLDKLSDIYPRNVAYWSGIYETSADSFYTNDGDKEQALTILQEWSLFDGSATLQNTYQPEIEYYYQWVVPYNLVLHNLTVEQAILSGLVEWSSMYETAFSSVSINPPGERVQVSAGQVFRMANSPAPYAEYTDGVDWLPIAGAADSVDSHGYVFVNAYKLFVNAGGIMFNIQVKFNGANARPTIEYRFPSPATTYIGSDRRWVETYAQQMGISFASGAYLPGYFDGVPTNKVFEQSYLATRELINYNWLGFIPSTLSFESIGSNCSSLSTLPAAYAECLDFNSSTVINDLAISSSYPIRGFTGDKNLSKFNYLYTDRAQLDPFIRLLVKIKEKSKELFYLQHIENNLSSYEHDFYWKDVSGSLANSATNCDSTTFPSGFASYYNADLGRGLNQFYEIYLKDFYRHPTRWDVLDNPGSNIVAHAFGPLNENHNFETAASSLGLYASAASLVESLSVDHPSFTSTVSGALSAASGVDFVVRLASDTKELYNSSIISKWTLIHTSGSSEVNSFSIFRMVKAYASEKVFNNTLIKLKSVNGLPRMKTIIHGILGGTIDSSPSSNFLLPDCDYSISIEGLAARENGEFLEDCQVGVCIHTKPEGGKAWVYDSSRNWIQLDTSAITKNRMLSDLSHFYQFTKKDRRESSSGSKFNFLCASAITKSSNNRFSMGNFKDEEFEKFTLSFDTNNKPIHIPEDYFSNYGQVHRKDQTYEVEVFLVPTSEDKFVVLNDVSLRNDTLYWKTKYEVTGIPSGKFYPRFCNAKYVDLDKWDIKVILDFYNAISGKLSGTGINSRDPDESSYLNLDGGGCRVSYRENITFSAVDISIEELEV